MLELLSIGIELPLGKNEVFVFYSEERASKGSYPHCSVEPKMTSIDGTTFCKAGDFNLRVVLVFMDVIIVGMKVAGGAVPNKTFDLDILVPNGQELRREQITIVMIDLLLTANNISNPTFECSLVLHYNSDIVNRPNRDLRPFVFDEIV
jgi:hypothetical protein